MPIDSELAKVTEPLAPALMRLQLETGTEDVVETYKTVFKWFIAIKVGTEMMEESPSDVPTDMVESIKTLEAGVSAIVTSA